MYTLRRIHVGLYLTRPNALKPTKVWIGAIRLIILSTPWISGLSLQSGVQRKQWAWHVSVKPLDLRIIYSHRFWVPLCVARKSPYTLMVIYYYSLLLVYIWYVCACIIKHKHFYPCLRFAEYPTLRDEGTFYVRDSQTSSGDVRPTFCTCTNLPQ